MGGIIRQALSDISGMIFPRLCEVCGTTLVKGEDVMCTECRHDMPRCRIHTDPFNTIHQRLAGHAPIERAAGYFYYYRGNAYTRPILAAKYNGRPVIIRHLAREFAKELTRDNFFDGIDMIIPVPLHWLKRLQRGYNQSRHIALGISDITGIPVTDHLKARRRHNTQTRRNAYMRWLNSLHIYIAIRPEELEHKHILIVDDVITTGATMLACCEAIHSAAPSAAISVLSIGVTQLA